MSGAQKRGAELSADVEIDVDAAIEACSGDVRAALRAAMVANAFLVAQVETLSARVSAGFVRRRRRTAVDERLSAE